jgi:hypothetical protein
VHGIAKFFERVRPQQDGAQVFFRHSEGLFHAQCGAHGQLIEERPWTEPASGTQPHVGMPVAGASLGNPNTLIFRWIGALG